MSFLGRLFGVSRSAPKAPNSRPHSQLASVQHSVEPSQSQNSTRRELLRVVLRDTLNRHGIPAPWVAAEMLMATTRGGERGIHWRILVKHWDPRLMVHGVALQQNLIKRLMTFDPMASAWLMGISWQFALDDETVCPPMPHPGVWTSEPHEEDTAPSPIPAGPSGDVIAGPVRIADAQQDAAATRADLEKLMALREDDFRRHGGDGPEPLSFPPTEPAKLI